MGASLQERIAERALCTDDLARAHDDDSTMHEN